MHKDLIINFDKIGAGDSNLILVVAFAIAGTVNIDFETQPIAVDGEGK